MPETYVRTPIVGKGCVTIESFQKDDGEAREVDDFNKAHVTTLSNSYPLKLMIPSKASENNSVWVYPVTFGGGLVGGDGVHMEFKVRQNCCAVITGQESTKVYHCEDNLITRQTTTGHVEDGGLLCVLSDPVVCYKQSHFIQTQDFHVSCDGNLVYLDWVIGGRIALDELWDLHSYQNKTDVYVDGQMLFRDNYMLEDMGRVTVKQAMANMQVMGSCILIGNRLKQVSQRLQNILGKKKSIGEKFERDVVYSVSPLRTKTLPGIYIRFMAASSTKAYKSVVSHIVKELTPLIGGNPFADKY